MALSRGTSTDYDDLLDKLDEFITADHVKKALINAAGSGYAENDILTVAGGTSTKAARILVTEVGDSGDITEARIYDSGAYSVDPTLTANAVTGGTGSSATFDLTMEASNWTKNLDDATLDSSTERVVWWEETTTDTYVGVRTYSAADGINTAKNWLLLGATSYSPGLNWWQQPDTNPNAVDASDGSVDTTPAGVGQGVVGMYLKGNDGTDIDYWFFATTRRIIVVAKLYNTVTTSPRYATGYMGLLNPFGTSAEYPYPLYIAGSMSDPGKAWNANDPAYQMSGLTSVIGHDVGFGSAFEAPAFYRHTDGFWKNVQNVIYETGSGSRSNDTVNDYVVYPCGAPNVSAGPDSAIVSTSTTPLLWSDMINGRAKGFSDNPLYALYPTPDSGGEKRVLVPATIVLSSGDDAGVVGELDGVYWASAVGTTTVTSEDTLTDSGIVYRAFQNGTYILWDGYQFIRED